MAIYSDEEDPNVTMWNKSHEEKVEEVKDELLELRKKELNEMMNPLPRIGDRILVDLDFQPGKELNATTKGRILGITETDFFISVSPNGNRLYVPHGAIKKDI